MPPQDEMLQFINASGLINVYIMVLSLLIAPANEEELLRYEGELMAIKLQAQLY